MQKPKLVLKFAVTLIFPSLIIWLLGGVGEIGSLMDNIDLRFVVPIILIITLDRALMTYKWARLLRSRGLNLPFFLGLRIYCASLVWGFFLPSTIGADAIRTFATSRSGLSLNEVVASIVIERMLGFLSILFLGLFSLILLTSTGALDESFQVVWGMAIAALAGALLAFAGSFSQRAFNYLHNRLLRPFQNTRVMRRLRQFHLTYLAYQNDRISMAVFFELTLLEQMMFILQFWLIALALGIEVNLLYVVGAVPLAALVARIPISVNGVGVYEGIFVMVMSLAGVTAAQAMIMSLVGRVLEIIA
jgi:uncharacterized protein (TIRG00374 family)